MTSAAGDPRAEYEIRLTARRNTQAAAEAADRRIGTFRLLLFVMGGAIAYAAFVRHAVSGWYLLVPAAAFVVLVIQHARAAERLRLAHRAIGFYTRAIGRLEDRWAGTGETGERFRNTNHPYSNDLDIFGTGSLFELISTARTRAGEATLAHWLLGPSPHDEILARQQAVSELRDRVDLREDLAVLGMTSALACIPKNSPGGVRRRASSFRRPPARSLPFWQV